MFQRPSDYCEPLRRAKESKNNCLKEWERLGHQGSIDIPILKIKGVTSMKNQEQKGATNKQNKFCVYPSDQIKEKIDAAYESYVIGVHSNVSLMVRPIAKSSWLLNLIEQSLSEVPKL